MSLMMEYSGFRSRGGWTPERISSTISPREMFERYISKRKPVILLGGLHDEKWLGDKWTLSTLAVANPGVEVDVEIRIGAGRFGRGLKKRMTVKEFVTRITEKNDESLFLTPQDIPLNEHGMRTALSAPPVAALRNEYPVKPLLMGNLEPFQYNSFIGSTRVPSSSGLHHDFHDNLYILLSGHKRFRVWSPNNVHMLKPAGKVQMTFPNGLICYSQDYRSDSADLDMVDRWLEEKAERELGGLDEVPDDENEEDDSEFFGSMNVEPEVWEEADSEIIGGIDDYEMKKTEAETSENVLPNNFSTLTPSEISELSNSKKQSPVVFDIKEGEMLYLPAGWFHEVSSRNSQVDGSKPYHFAFNYWFAPPAINNFEAPYIDDYWKEFVSSVNNPSNTDTLEGSQA